MTVRLIEIASLLLAASNAAFPECRPAHGDYILGSDLAAADSRFTALSPFLQLRYTPLSGSTRTFSVLELQRIARANGVATESTPAGFVELCFEFPLHAPTDAEFLDSMRTSLPPDSAIGLLDMTSVSVPAGVVMFPLTSLEPAAKDGSQLWRGFVQYTDTRRVAIWARVRISVAYTAVVARKTLPADTIVDAASLSIMMKTGGLKRDAIAARIEDLAGKVLRRPVEAGAEIPLSLVDRPPVVRHGDSVRVEVQSGSAVLHLDAIAQTNGRAGDWVEFRNPVTGKTFRARAESGPKAVVVVGEGSRL